MNSTVWHTLTTFVLYLGESGKCKIDENEKGIIVYNVFLLKIDILRVITKKYTNN